jgi:beta-phosphoglucomutase
MTIKAVIFDLDGVIVSTDEYHYEAWQRLADDEGIYFDRQINQRLRGVSRMASLEILLERATRRYSDAEKQEMAERKNGYYRELLKQLTPQHLLPGVRTVMDELKRRGIKVAIGSASKNTPGILCHIGLPEYFDAVADGNCIAKSKPDPEVFLVAAKMLNVPPQECLVVEDAIAGVEAALAGGMRTLAVGFASQDPRATLRAKDLASVISVDQLLAV